MKSNEPCRTRQEVKRSRLVNGPAVGRQDFPFCLRRVPERKERLLLEGSEITLSTRVYRRSKKPYRNFCSSSLWPIESSCGAQWPVVRAGNNGLRRLKVPEHAIGSRGLKTCKGARTQQGSRLHCNLFCYCGVDRVVE